MTSEWGYIDTQGTFVIAPEFDAATRFVDGLAFVERKDRRRLITEMSYIDVKGRVVYTRRFTGVG